MKAVFVLSALALQLCIAAATIECKGSNCMLENYQGAWLDGKPCTISKVFYPTTEVELVQAVGYAVEHKQKVKVVSKYAHTLTKFACPNSEEGHDGVLISTSKYNSGMVVDKKRMTATADAGVQLREFIDWLAEQGYALEQTTTWEGVSVSGMISTGAHGTGLWGKGGATAEYVVGLRVVVPASAEQGFAKVVMLTNEDQDKELFNAARISLGVLGAISRVTFAVQPLFKRSVTERVTDDKSLENDIVALPRAHEFVDVHWFPSVGKFVARTDDRVAISTPGEGSLVVGAFLPMEASAIRQAREAEERQQAAGNATAYCATAQSTVAAVTTSGDGLLNDGKRFTGFPVVGYNHKLQSAGGCQYTYENKTNLALPEDQRLVCLWDYNAHGSFWFHISVSVQLTKVVNFIKDVKELRARLPISRLCMIDSYIGIEFRFVKESSAAYLGEREDVAVVELITFRDRMPGQPQAFGDVVEEIEQMLVYKYKGKPHFGKNRPHAFYNVRKKVKNISKFLQARQKLDPDGLFSSKWSDAVLGIGGSVVTLKDGCALDGLCVCRKDEHCSPRKGYLCYPGLVYKDARVCKKS